MYKNLVLSGQQDKLVALHHRPQKEENINSRPHHQQQFLSTLSSRTSQLCDLLKVRSHDATSLFLAAVGLSWKCPGLVPDAAWACQNVDQQMFICGQSSSLKMSPSSAMLTQPVSNDNSKNNFQQNSSKIDIIPLYKIYLFNLQICKFEN